MEQRLVFVGRRQAVVMRTQTQLIARQSAKRLPLRRRRGQRLYARGDRGGRIGAPALRIAAARLALLENDHFDVIPLGIVRVRRRDGQRGEDGQQSQESQVYAHGG